MRRTEIHFGVIRDKKGIHAGLLQSKASNRQLAICYTSEGKLLVKICTVMDIKKDGSGIILRSQADGPAGEITITMDHIESIYPIRDFE